jgi:hypothetical protein
LPAEHLQVQHRRVFRNLQAIWALGVPLLDGGFDLNHQGSSSNPACRFVSIQEAETILQELQDQAWPSLVLYSWWLTPGIVKLCMLML